MNYIKSCTLCPVCGYDLGFEPWHGESASHEYCPSCGIQFGYHDVPEGAGIEMNRQDVYTFWRQRWIQGGLQWDSPGLKPPTDWNPREQLDRLHERQCDP